MPAMRLATLQVAAESNEMVFSSITARRRYNPANSPDPASIDAPTMQRRDWLVPGRVNSDLGIPINAMEVSRIASGGTAIQVWPRIGSPRSGSGVRISSAVPSLIERPPKESR